MASPFKSAAKRPRSWFMPRKPWTSQHRTRPLFELLEDRVTPSLLYGATPVFPAGGDTSATISLANTTTNIAATTNGDIFVAYGGDSVRVATSTNRGLSFQTSDILSSDTTSEVAVTTEGASDVYVAWTASGSETSDAYLSVSTDDGATWSAPQTVTTTGDFNGGVGGINLAVYGSQVYVESSSFGGDVYVNDNNGIGTYKAAGVIPQNYLKLQVDPANGVAYTIGDTSGPLFLAESMNSGTSFSPQMLSNPGDVTVVDSTVASSFGQAGNFAFVAGDGNADGTDPTAAAKINLATDAVTPLTVGDNTVDYERSLAADAFGNLVDSYDESGVLKYEVSQNLGASFAAPVTVADGASSNVAINPAYQDILVVYQVGNNLYLNVYDGELAGASPTITTTASPATATLGTSAPTISDSAVVTGADNATGSLSFVLDLGNTQVYSTSDPLTGDGNGTYGASYTLPTTGTVTGTYTWHVSYAGDALNNSAVDQGGTAEQTVVSAASPTLVTTASPNGTITLGTTSQTLSDSADLEGAYFPSGSITFSLSYNGGTPFFVASDPVSHNGTPDYGASYTLLSNCSQVTGTYDWSAVYSGDGNNNTASDPGTSDQEQVTVSAATPTITVSAGPPVVLGTGVKLTASAMLAGGYYETGSITFTLYNPSNTPVDTETATVSGNGTYTTPSGYLPSIAGTYQWVASYGGDANNNGASTTNGSTPEAAVSAGVSVVGNTLYLVGGNTNDQLNISPIGASQTGSTGISVTGRLNNVNINQTYTQAFTTIYVVGLGGNDNFQFAGSLTIATVVSDGDGNDTIQVGNGTNTVTVGNGNDTIQGGGGSVQGGNGNNIIMAGNGNDTVTLGNGNNSITVGTGNDNIQLGNGTNTVTAGATGSTSNDQIQLANGNNDSVTLLGNGNNQVTLGNGNDDSVTLNGNGNDTVQVGNGTRDSVSLLGNGNDTVQVGNGTGDSVSLLGNGNDTVQTGNGTGTVYLPGTGKKTLHLGSGWTRI